MKHVVTKFIVLLLCSSFSNLFAYERINVDASYFSEKDSIALVLKINGRIGCGYFNSLLHKNNIQATHSCDSKLVQNRVESLSKDVKYESFLVVNKIRGEFQPGEMIKVPYERNPGPSVLQIGEEGIIFFNKSTYAGKETYLYNSCDVFYADDMKAYFSSRKDYSEGSIIDYIIDRNLSICSQLENK